MIRGAILENNHWMSSPTLDIVVKTNLVGHYTHACWVFVDQDMVRSSVRAGFEDILVGLVGQGKEARDNRLLEPRWQRCFHQCILDEVGRPGLQPTMRELLPSGFRSGGNLRARREAGCQWERFFSTKVLKRLFSNTLSNIWRSSSSLMKSGM